jgi:hypothetical protein
MFGVFEDFKKLAAPPAFCKAESIIGFVFEVGIGDTADVFALLY